MTITALTEAAAGVPFNSPRLSSAEAVERYRTVRAWTDHLVEPLEVEDHVVQSMPDASPTKWHLAHTSWFFETFLLTPHHRAYRPLDERYAYLFNSYYNSLGEQFNRADRGLLSRPSVAEVMAYRHHVDTAMESLLEAADEAKLGELLPLLQVGLNHEQQHQELILTDLKNMLAQNPLFPVYRPEPNGEGTTTAPPDLGWHSFPEGLYQIGRTPGGEFSFDNEAPRHRVFAEAFQIASRPVTCGEYLDFMADGGYDQPDLWLAEGWHLVNTGRWQAPLYWHRHDAGWQLFTLAGRRDVRGAEPVCHLSFYEADAYARWAGARLPLEAEWEVAAVDRLGDDHADVHADAHVGGEADPLANLAEDGHFHPRPGVAGGRGQFLGDVWEWTASAYSAYPGYRPPEGALGEYNAKFMSNQMVLRGGSCATPRSHIRATYRNFFPPAARWQFSGLRLARDGAGR